MNVQTGVVLTPKGAKLRLIYGLARGEHVIGRDGLIPGAGGTRLAESVRGCRFKADYAFIEDCGGGDVRWSVASRSAATRACGPKQKDPGRRGDYSSGAGSGRIPVQTRRSLRCVKVVRRVLPEVFVNGRLQVLLQPFSV